MTTRQIVYRYRAGWTGAGEFAVWHLGTAELRVYGPEGDPRGFAHLATPDRASADRAARSHGVYDSADESSNLYPAGAS
jgi:hypothetical protein